MGIINRAEARLKRKKRVRKKIMGKPERPRLTVFRSAKHIYAQVIDDTSGRTLAEGSSLSKEIREEIQGKGGNKAGAQMVGAFVAQRAMELGIKQVVFDRNGFLYHGRIRALAEAAREQGLGF
jgi:large subunit ribosomal protein L18